MVSQRSRSPRGKGAGKRSLPAPSQLALPAPPTTKGSGKKGKTGKGKKGSQGGKNSSASSTSPAGITPSNFRSFDQIMLKGDNRKLFYKLSGRSMCFLFQSGKCSDSACPRVHCCVGCGKALQTLQRMRLSRVYRSLRWPHFSDARLKLASPITAGPVSAPSSNLSARMTSRISTSRVLLFATDPAHCGEVAEGWKLAQCQDALEYFLEVVFVNCSLVTNVTDIFYVLDLIASGYFDFVLVLPPAATWSRARHKSNAGQDPLRSRSFPLGIPSLSPDAQSKVLLDNEHLEYAAWILECSLLCERAKVDSILVFPEDPGGHEHHGPASVWQLREFQVLECDHDARRGAGFLCQLAHAEQKRPLGILTTLAALHSDLCVGWSKFVLDQNELRYVGPLPRDCGCPTQHSPMVGYNTDQHFFSSISPTLGPLFWNVFGRLKLKRNYPLGMGSR